MDTRRPASDGSLRPKQATARAVAGIAFGAAAARCGTSGATGRRAVGAVAAWFAVSHVVAAITRFDGCPELGAVASLVLGREVATECGPWDYLDDRLRLVAPKPHAPGAE
jgi:hypothetical protein